MARTVITTKSGQKLTDADIERLADAAEKGFDLSTWEPRPRPVGRPQLETSAEGHSPRIAVRIPAALRSRVELRARGEGRSLSQVVRGLLEEYARTGR
jgi:hypothetical protein